MGSRIYSISLSDWELIQWVDKMREQGKCPSFSMVLRDGLLKKKKELEIMNGENNPKILRERLEDLKGVVGKFTEFLEKNKLNEAWFEYNEKKDQRVREKEIFARKGIEVIEIDKSKGKKKNVAKNKNL